MKPTAIIIAAYLLGFGATALYGTISNACTQDDGKCWTASGDDQDPPFRGDQDKDHPTYDQDVPPAPSTDQDGDDYQESQCNGRDGC